MQVEKRLYNSACNECKFTENNVWNGSGMMGYEYKSQWNMYSKETLKQNTKYEMEMRELKFSTTYSHKFLIFVKENHKTTYVGGLSRYLDNADAMCLLR